MKSERMPRPSVRSRAPRMTPALSTVLTTQPSTPNTSVRTTLSPKTELRPWKAPLTMKRTSIASRIGPRLALKVRQPKETASPTRHSGAGAPPYPPP